MLHQRRTLCGDAICLMFITPLASLSGWLCVQGAMDLYYSNSMEAIGLIVLTLTLFTIYLFWTIVSIVIMQLTYILKHCLLLHVKTFSKSAPIERTVN